MRLIALTLLALSVFAPADARADIIRIGDIDGFGYGAASGFRAANGRFANRRGAGVLDSGDFLPDINRNGILANGQNDEFDFRTAAERMNTSVAPGVGVTNLGTAGSRFTDISLARTYDARRAANAILVGGNPDTGLTFGPGGPFPDGDSDALPNQPGFLFLFEVNKGDLNPSPIFFNLVFGDYDVLPARIRIILADGSRRILDLTQQNNATSDGLIQAATATLAFEDVFTDGGAVWRGSLDVDFIAPNEPYTAFDYVELSRVALVPGPGAGSVPEPASLFLFGSVSVAAGGWYRRRRVTG